MWNENNCNLRCSILYDTSTAVADDAFTVTVLADEDNLEELRVRITKIGCMEHHELILIQ